MLFFINFFLLYLQITCNLHYFCLKCFLCCLYNSFVRRQVTYLLSSQEDNCWVLVKNTVCKIANPALSAQFKAGLQGWYYTNTKQFTIEAFSVGWLFYFWKIAWLRVLCWFNLITCLFVVSMWFLSRLAMLWTHINSASKFKKTKYQTIFHILGVQIPSVPLIPFILIRFFV